MSIYTIDVENASRVFITPSLYTQLQQYITITKVGGVPLGKKVIKLGISWVNKEKKKIWDDE